MTGGVKFISDVAVCHTNPPTHQPPTTDQPTKHCLCSASLADDKDDYTENDNEEIK